MPDSWSNIYLLGFVVSITSIVVLTTCKSKKMKCKPTVSPGSTTTKSGRSGSGGSGGDATEQKTQTEISGKPTRGSKQRKLTEKSKAELPPAENQKNDDKKEGPVVEDITQTEPPSAEQNQKKHDLPLRKQNDLETVEGCQSNWGTFENTTDHH